MELCVITEELPPQENYDPRSFLPPVRNIWFANRKEKKEWAFPLPHLLGMVLVRANSTMNLAKRTVDDALILYFSAGTIRVDGRELENLWGKLVLVQAETHRPFLIELEPGSSSVLNHSYFIADIQSEEEWATSPAGLLSKLLF